MEFLYPSAIPDESPFFTWPSPGQFPTGALWVADWRIDSFDRSEQIRNIPIRKSVGKPTWILFCDRQTGWTARCRKIERRGASSRRHIAVARSGVKQQDVEDVSSANTIEQLRRYIATCEAHDDLEEVDASGRGIGGGEAKASAKGRVESDQRAVTVGHAHLFGNLQKNVDTGRVALLSFPSPRGRGASWENSRTPFHPRISRSSGTSWRSFRSHAVVDDLRSHIIAVANQLHPGKLLSDEMVDAMVESFSKAEHTEEGGSLPGPKLEGS